jgi:hypothetical protein
MKFTVEINCDNAAFEDEGHLNEIGRILKRLAETVVDYKHGGILRDINCNVVGYFAFTE